MPFNIKAFDLIIDETNFTDDEKLDLKLTFGIFGNEINKMNKRIEALEQKQAKSHNHGPGGIGGKRMSDMSED